MPKKNQSKSDKKVLPLNNQKKPLPKPDPSLTQIAYCPPPPKPDPNLRQIAYKRIHKDAGKIKKHK